MKIGIVFTIFFLAATTAISAGPADILGIWRTENDESKVEIFRCGEEFCGRIIWLDPKFSDSRDGEAGTRLTDSKNPDPALRSRPLIGLQIMEGFKPQGENTWGEGACYDPKSGKTYRGKIHLAAPNRLELRGYVGIPLFGRTAVWSR